MKFCIGPQILSNNCTDSCFKMFLARKLFLNIGGHGFWDKGGVNTRGCPQKNFPAAFGGRKIFSPAPPPGGEKFFPVGCLFSRPGGDFAKKMEKMASPGGQKFFFPGCFAPRGAPPPVFFHAGCRAIFAHHPWVHPPQEVCLLLYTLLYRQKLLHKGFRCSLSVKT